MEDTKSEAAEALLMSCAAQGDASPETAGVNSLKVKEIKPLRGGLACYAAPALVPIDAEIGQKN